MNCTNTCEVVGTEYFKFNLIDRNDPNGGVHFQYDAMPPVIGGECARAVSCRSLHGALQRQSRLDYPISTRQAWGLPVWLSLRITPGRLLPV